MNKTIQIKERAIELGFDIVGVTDATPITDREVEIMAEWLDGGSAGQMGYMGRNFEKRINPGKLLEGAKSVISVGLNYTPREQDKVVEGDVGRVASYACYNDYHSFIKERLYQLVDFLKQTIGADERFKVCVDSVPIAERSIAMRAGLGFIGKNHMLIRPGVGCRIFLGEIVTTASLEPDEPFVGDCGKCTRCIDVCPTGALWGDGKFDARKCINYLTIEHKEGIEPELASKMGRRVYGCEDCIAVCPYQVKGKVCDNRQFKFHADRRAMKLHEILEMDQEAFEACFADSVILRTGLESLKRNAQICLENIQSGRT